MEGVKDKEGTRRVTRGRIAESKKIRLDKGSAEQYERVEKSFRDAFNGVVRSVGDHRVDQNLGKIVMEEKPIKEEIDLAILVRSSEISRREDNVVVMEEEEQEEQQVVVVVKEEVDLDDDGDDNVNGETMQETEALLDINPTNETSIELTSVSTLFHIIQPFMSRDEDLQGTTRSLSFDPVKCLSTMDLQQLMENTRRFLDDCGESIWHLSICTYSKLETTSGFYSRLESWLSKLPNLKSLHVVTDAHVGRKREGVAISSLNFPSLSKLEKLSLEWNDRNWTLAAQPFFRPLVDKFLTNNLLSLEIPGVCWKRWQQDVWDKKNPDKPIPDRLSHLTITRHYSSRLTSFDMLFPCSASLQSIKVGVSRMFTDLNGSSQLRVLDISSYKTHIRKFSSTYWNSWSMPMLHTLKLRHQMEPYGYEVLLRLPALKNVQIFVDLDFRKRGTLEEWMMKGRKILEGHNLLLEKEGCKEISRYVYQDSTSDSTLIWQLIPSLENLKISFLIKERNPEKSALKNVEFRREDYV